MLEWLAANAASIAVVLVLAVVVALIVWKMVRDKKRGRGGCSCGGNCASCGACHSTQKIK